MPLNDRRLLMVRKVFNTLDRDNSGIITIEDICKLLIILVVFYFIELLYYRE